MIDIRSCSVDEIYMFICFLSGNAYYAVYLGSNYE